MLYVPWVVFNDAVMLLLAPNGYPRVVGGIHAGQVGVVPPAVHAAVVDEAEGPLLDRMVDRAPDVDLGVALALLDQLVREVAEDLAHAVLAGNRVSVDVCDRESRVRELVGGEFSGFHAVLPDAEYVGDHDVRAGDLLD